MIEIDPGEVQVIVVESAFQARNFGTEPARDIPVTVNGDADLTLLDDGVNLNCAESIGANSDVHLRVRLSGHLQIGGGTGKYGRGWWGDGSGRRSVEHLVSLGQCGRGIGVDFEWRRGSWRSGSS
jgi:hypothetical protein